MQSVNIAELRSHLSLYLDRVRQGEEILVRDRKLAVARIVPLGRAGELDDELLQLAAQGLVRLPEKTPNWREFFKLQAPGISRKKLSAALEAEREE